VAHDYRIVSADSHLDLSPERWTQRVPAKWRDLAPKVVKLESGAEAFLMPGGKPAVIDYLQHAGVEKSEIHKQVPTFAKIAGAGDPEQRLKEQDQDGIDAEILFSTQPGNVGMLRSIEDSDAYVAINHAYNEYLAEEYAAVNPSRLIPLGVIPVAGVDAAVKELEYCARAGFKGIQLDRYPSGNPFPGAEDDKFWAAAIALKMPITHHCGSGSTRMAREDEPTFEYKKSDSPDRAGGFFARDPMRPWFFRYTFEGIVAPVQLAMAGVYDRFPDLQIYWGETLIGWLPSTLVQVQSNYERYKHLARDQFGFDFLEEPIGEYVRRHNLWGFLSDPHGIRMRHDIGVDTIMWGSDFAHAAGDWPHSLKQIEREYADVPEEEKRAMIGGNAIRFFHLD